MNKSNKNHNAPLSRRHLLLVFFYLIPSIPAFFNQSPVFRHYYTDHSLASNETYDILQDDNGYLWTASPERNYPDLQPGEYRFGVQAQDEQGRWRTSAFLPIFIGRPWWFTGLSTLVLAGIGLALYKNRTARLKREVAIQRLRAERIEEKMNMEAEIDRLKQSALRAQINPHFIFNCLNSIQSFMLDSDRDEAVHYLSQFARLIRLILNASLKNHILLEDELRMLETYLELEKMRHKSGFDYHIEVADDIIPFDIEIPPLLIQPYVENAIVHGLCDEHTAGQVDIRYRRENGHLVVSVTDNGIGIEASLRRKKGNASLHHSIGISITQKRLELLQPERRKDAVDMNALTDPEGKVIGTRVTVQIPLEATEYQAETVAVQDSIKSKTGNKLQTID